jgi:hypothetical protein
MKWWQLNKRDTDLNRAPTSNSKKKMACLRTRPSTPLGTFSGTPPNRQ